MVLIKLSIDRARMMLDPLIESPRLSSILILLFHRGPDYPGLLVEAVRSAPIHRPAHTHFPSGTCARAGAAELLTA